MKYAFPAAYGESCYLVPIDSALIPLVAGALRYFEERGAWLSESDYEQGYNAFAELQSCMNGRCIEDLVAAQERTYRLLDRAFNGTAYAATPDPIDPLNNPPVISPPIPIVPLTTPISPGLLARFERLLKIEDNMATGRVYPIDVQNPGDPLPDNILGVRETIESLQGVLDPGWFGIGGSNATLTDIVKALRIGGGDQKDSVLATISQILGSGGSAATVFGAVQDLFSDTVDLAADGAMIGVLVASTLAGAAIAAQQQLATTQMLQRLDLVLAALRGDDVPTDNILQALRGDDDATADRNIASLLS